MNTAFYDKDFRKSFLAAYQSVPVAWKKAFFAAMAVNILVFFFDLAQFPLGDHDVGYEDGIPLLSGGRSGRWFAPVLYLLSGHVQIPVYTQLLAFASQIAAGMAAVLLWFPAAGAWPLFVGGTVVSCMPAVTDFYYYHWQVLGFTCSQLFMILALHLTLRGHGHSMLRYVVAVVLCTTAMAGYQSSIMTWTACFWGWLLMVVLQWDGSNKTLLAQCWSACLAVACFLVAGLLYSVSLSLYPLVGLSLELYQFQTIPLTALPKRLLELAKQSWLHLVVPQGFMSLWLKMLLLGGMAGGAAAMLHGAARKERRTLRLCFLTAGILLFPMAAKSQFLVSGSSEWYLYRFLALGLSYAYLFFFLFLFTSGAVRARNAGFALFAFLLPCMAVNCLDQQVRHVRQANHDMAVLNRVVGRIESLPDYHAEKRYDLVQLGCTIPYLKDVPGMGTHNPLASQTVSQAWNPGFELWLLSKYLKLGDRINEEAVSRPDLMEKALAFVQGKRPFPAPGSIGIVDDCIILYFDSAAVPKAQTRLRQMEGK